MGPKVLMTAKTLATPGLALLEQAGCAVSFLKEGTEAELAEKSAVDSLRCRHLPHLGATGNDDRDGTCPARHLPPRCRL